jgi:hypothetical protein
MFPYNNRNEKVQDPTGPRTRGEIYDEARAKGMCEDAASLEALRRLAVEIPADQKQK